MRARKIVKSKRPGRLYHATKISDYRFRKVLGLFVRDCSATKTAQETGLSVNSVVAIFRKLRVYFTEVDLFTDFYDGNDPLTYESDNIIFERDLLEFHFKRVRAKQGLKSPANEPDYHFAESHWRYNFQVLMRERSSGTIHAMMLSHLLEIIRVCGPIGTRPTNRRAGILVVERQMNQRILWLERNGAQFRDEAMRQELRNIHAI